MMSVWVWRMLCYTQGRKPSNTECFNGDSDVELEEIFVKFRVGKRGFRYWASQSAIKAL